MSQPFSLTSDSEVEERVRTLTGYEDTSEELPSSDFSTASENEGVLGAAKAKIYTDVGLDDWYTDHHVGEALAYTAAILAKDRLENYTVESWTIGNGAESVEVRDASPGDSRQIESWANEVEQSLAKSSKTDGTGIPRLTMDVDF